MTSEEVKRKFESMLDFDLLIDSKLAEKRELKRRLTDIKSPSFGDRVQSTKDPDKFSEVFSKIIELEKEVDSDIDKLLELKKECRTLIETLKNNLHKAVLHKIYFEGKTLKLVSMECGRSIRQIANIRNDCFVQIAENSKLH